jgi:hypothetical protein
MGDDLIGRRIDGEQIDREQGLASETTMRSVRLTSHATNCSASPAEEGARQELGRLIRAQ